VSQYEYTTASARHWDAQRGFNELETEDGRIFLNALSLARNGYIPRPWDTVVVAIRAGHAFVLGAKA